MKFFSMIGAIFCCSVAVIFSSITTTDLIQTRNKLRNNFAFMKKTRFFAIHNQVILQLKYNKNWHNDILKKTTPDVRYFYERKNLAKEYKNLAESIHIKKQIKIIDDILTNIYKYTSEEGPLPPTYYAPRLLGLMKKITQIATIEQKKEDVIIIDKEEMPKKENLLIRIKENYFNNDGVVE